MLSKPSWLVNLLASLNWTILTWHIDIGTPVEAALDWLIAWLNSVIESAVDLWAALEDLKQEALDWLTELEASITGGLDWLWSYIDTWWDTLRLWWEARKAEILGWIEEKWAGLEDWFLTKQDLILGWIEEATTWLSYQIDNLVGRLNEIWDDFLDFWHNILPTLASHLDVQEAINNLLLTWSDLFNTWEALKDSILEFFNDPWAWLYNRFDDFIERFW